MRKVTQPWVIKADEIIGWDWMELEPILVALSPLVSPGAAMRRVERDRERNRNQTPETSRRYPNRPKSTGVVMVRQGQRSVVRDGIASHKTGGSKNQRSTRIYEFENRDGVYYVRKRERRKACNCRDCPERRQHG